MDNNGDTAAVEGVPLWLCNIVERATLRAALEDRVPADADILVLVDQQSYKEQ